MVFPKLKLNQTTRQIHPQKKFIELFYFYHRVREKQEEGKKHIYKLKINLK